MKPAAAQVLDEKGGYLKSPEGVACTKTSVVVADTGNGRLVRYGLQDDAFKGGAEVKVSQLPAPTKVQMNSKGEVLVLDGKQRRVVRVSPEGAFVGYADPAGTVVKSFAMDGADHLYLLDVRQERVVVTDQAGKKVGEIPFPAGYGFLSDITVDGKGNVFVLDSVKSTVFVAARDAKIFKPLTQSLREYLDFAASITTDPQGKIFISDQNGSAIILLGPDGSFQGRQLTMGRKPGVIYYPAQACVTEAGDFIIADRNNSRIQLFKLIR